MWSKTGIITTLSAALFCTTMQAQDTVHYSGNTLSYVTQHHGRLPLAMGVHNIQVLRASREDSSAKNGYGWTYNHAPMLAYWNNTFYLEYLSNPVGEHVPPGRTLLVTSKDGRAWSDPVVIFPEYKVPDGFKKEGREGVAHDLYAVMHQRMGFYTASNKKLLALAFYGIAMDQKDDPNDGNGIGRVVREIKTDGSYGPIYFIRYNHSFNEQNSSFPFYKKSKDKAFVAACDELLSKPLMMQQWNEEADRNDPLIPLKKDFKAFNFYHLPDGRAVGLWKHALTSITNNEGKTWQYNPLRAPGFVNSNAKIWGQRTQDGKYATVYNPAEFRWPLALSVSNDGLNYTNLLLVNGEITPMRYGGNYKSYGPQYVRGIQEGDGIPPDGNLWVTYSMNKEDIWVSVIPVPVKDKTTTPVNEVFAQMKAGTELKEWNIFSPVYAPVAISSMSNGVKALTLKDSDPFDYAKAERLFPASRKMTIEFEVVPMQIKGSNLQIEVQDAQGTPGLRLVLEGDSIIKAKVGARFKRIAPYEAGKPLAIKLDLTLATRMYTVTVNGKPAGGATLFYQPLAAMERIVFRTGDIRHFPHEDTPADNFEDMKGTGEKIPEAVYYISYLKTFAE